jgi:uncharacterized protein (TIGR03067 family)
MNLTIVSAMCCLLPAMQAQIGPFRAFEPTVRDELRKLQGSWEIESQEEDGKLLSEKELKGRTICFSINVFLMRQNTSLIQLGKLDLNPSKSPKSINAKVDKGKQQGDTLPGIYLIEGDTLKICLNADGEARPKEFKSDPKSGLTLLVCKRLKPKPEEGDLTGDYRAESVDIVGRKIVYDASFERLGDTYLVVYSVGGKAVYYGTGLRKGDVFAMCWLSQGMAGISLYQIEKGPRLVGRFAGLGDGFLGSEIITRALKDL